MATIEKPKPEVVEIDINKKYVLVFKRTLSGDEIIKIGEMVMAWIKSSDHPFMIIDDQVELVKL